MHIPLFLLLICFLGTAIAEEETDCQPPFDLFSEPSAYVNGVNVITGHFTYSTTDMVIQGPHTQELKRFYVQGGSWEANWESEMEFDLSFDKLVITHGPNLGLSFKGKYGLNLDEYEWRIKRP